MNKISRLKTELSKLSGVDFHNPKFREVFKRYMDDEPEVEETTPAVEDAKAQDVIADRAVVDKATEVVEDIATDKEAETAGEQPDYAETNKDETELIEAVEEDKQTDAEVEQTTAEESETEPTNETEPETTLEPEPELSAEEKALRNLIGEPEENKETPTEEAEVETEAESQPAVNLNDQLLETQLELELVKAGVREDRLDVAKRLFLPELKAGASVDAVRSMIAQYPEWIGKQSGAQGFGMPIGDKSSVLTNEERELKRMGINPRD